MQFKRYPVVEILTKIPFTDNRDKRKNSSSVHTLTNASGSKQSAPAGSPKSPKRQKLIHESIDTEDDNQSSDVEIDTRRPSRLSMSPTVSDLEARMNINQTLPSPTVSELQLLQSPSTPPVHRSSSSSNRRYTGTSESETQEPIFHQFLDDEVTEDEGLEIDGETPLDDYTDNGKEDLFRQRILDNFVLYDLETLELIPGGQLLEPLRGGRVSFGVSGVAKPWVEVDSDDSDEDEEGNLQSEGQPLKLNRIVEVNLHHYNQENNSVDGKIYIRSKFAWYILRVPSPVYTSFFAQVWTQHRILHLIVSASLEQPRITYEQFINNFDDFAQEVQDEGAATAYEILGRQLSPDDMKSDETRTYLLSLLPDLCRDSSLYVSRVPLIRTIAGSINLHNNVVAPTSGSRPKAPKSRNISKKLKNTTDFTVMFTPVVSSIGQNLFKGFEVVGTAEFQEMEGNLAAEIDEIQEHHWDPENTEWGQPFCSKQGFYRSVVMDGVEYKIGDNVMVMPGIDERTSRAKNADSEPAQSVNLFGNFLWFCRINYFFDKTDTVAKKTVKFFHGQWYAHGSKTILQETAHSKALYLMNECGDNPIASIVKKCNVKMLSHIDIEIPDDRISDSNDFHCGLVWNEDKTEFVDIPTKNEERLVLEALPRHQRCYSCGLKRTQTYFEELHRIPGGFTLCGYDYHARDFIYIRPNETSGLLDIAQIISIQENTDTPAMKVNYLGRYDDFVRKKKEDDPSVKLVSDERRLYLSSRKAEIYADRIDGICYVQHLTDRSEIEKWVTYDHHYYLNQLENDEWKLRTMDQDEFDFCTPCYRARMDNLKRSERFMDRSTPLCGLELFSGAGGLGTGMNMSGFVETKYAIELSPSAAKTYQFNHPDTIVYCQDSNALLAHAIADSEGRSPPTLMSCDGKTKCPPMPKKGEIDFIFGGPPCQSFSRANHNPRADDPRSNLPGNMLSYAEHYSPDYFLLENVQGILNFPLLSEQGINTLKGGIKSGVVKFIMRTLIALGYQVRYKVLQAGQYGAPQSRNRVIFWAAKRGLYLPEHPPPMYAWPRPGQSYYLPTGDKLKPVSRSQVQDDYHQCAPLRFIGVNDAIGDLPQFDWYNPHKVRPRKARDRAEDENRLRILNIPVFDAVSINGADLANPGYPNGTDYSLPPQNRYQQWLRHGMANDKGKGTRSLQGHYTRRFHERIVEATTTVPLRGFATHHDLPRELMPSHALPGRKSSKHTYYGRLDGNDYFRCALTKMGPTLKNLWVLHPSQKRILTVRECARAQGFPDHYIFLSDESKPSPLVDSQTKQIGNAVPVPLALALGKELGRALQKVWEDKQLAGSPAV